MAIGWEMLIVDGESRIYYQHELFGCLDNDKAPGCKTGKMIRMLSCPPGRSCWLGVQFQIQIHSCDGSSKWSRFETELVFHGSQGVQRIRFRIILRNVFRCETLQIAAGSCPYLVKGAAEGDDAERKVIRRRIYRTQRRSNSSPSWPMR